MEERTDATSALWNLALYQLPAYRDWAANAKPDDLIPYRFCPHIVDRETLQNATRRVAFCMIHIAYMCGECWACHSHECKEERRRAT